MTYTVTDWIADQLRAAAPQGDWNSNGIDRARELAEILKRNGIIDLSRLGAEKVIVRWRPYPWADIEERPEIALTYEGRRIGYLGTPNEPARDDFLQGYTLLAWSAEGHGHIAYRAVFTPQGFTIQPFWGSSSDWGTFREVVRFFVTAYLAFVMPATGVGAGASVGGFIMGASFAASYPLLTAIIGNIAIGAYFSGGDVKKAVKGALIAEAASSVGAAAGGLAYSATSIDIIAQLSDAAVRAFVAGGDVDKAVASVLIQNGLNSMDDLFSGGQDPYAPQPLPAQTDTGGGFSMGTDLFQMQAPADGSGGFNFAPVSFAPEGYQADNLPTGFDMTNPLALNTAAPAFDAGLNTPASGYSFPTMRVEPPMSPVAAGNPTGGNLVNQVSSFALAALKLTQAWNQARNPQPITQARANTASGATVAALNTGVVQTRAPDGTVSAARPPVGVPQSTVTGDLIVNNGDGTYTLISPDGRRRVIQYGANSGSDSGAGPLGVSWPVWIALAGLGVTILK